MTIKPGSCCPLLRATCAAAHHPNTNAAVAAAASAAVPPKLRMIQPQGRAANDAHVPGIAGSSPTPNPVAISAAGCHHGRPSFELLTLKFRRRRKLGPGEGRDP